MFYQRQGLQDGPVLFCIPGLIGGPEDFNEMLGSLGKEFTIILSDPNQKQRANEGLNLSLETMTQLSYDSTSEEVRDLIVSTFPGREYYFLGLSLGGKVVYDFATKFPELFKGGVITDVGPGSFSESELFKAIEAIVDHTDLNLPWPELKASLQALIKDKNLRILIQTQIAYPHKVPPAVWKTGMKNFENFLKRQSLDDQEEAFKKVDQRLAKDKKWIQVLHSGKLSGIGNPMHEKLKSMSSVKLHEYPEAGHFLHITHKEEIVKLTLELLNLCAVK